jgi:hypothetical protein
MADEVEFPDIPQNFIPKTVSSLRSSIVSRGGVQHASRYLVEIVTPEDSFVTYPIEINLPQRALATYTAGQPQALWGTTRKVPLMHEFDEVTMSFVIYQDWAERNFFEKWMDFIINKGNYEDQYYEYARPYFSYVGKIYISTLKNISNLHRPTKPIGFSSMTLLDEAYPLSLMPISLSADNTGYATYVVNFAYRKYYNLEVSSGNMIEFEDINNNGRG